MSKIIAGMTISLDGFINDRNGRVDKLYTDFEDIHTNGLLTESIENTGAVIMGKHSYEMADPFIWINDDYEFQVPIFVLAHTAPAKYPKGNGKLSITFVTDGIESAVKQAKVAVGEKNVTVVGGANVNQQLLKAGLVDEIHVDIMPIILGKGVRLFGHLEEKEIKLEKFFLKDYGQRTAIKFRVLK